jgi:hypothetical protein
MNLSCPVHAGATISEQPQEWTAEYVENSYYEDNERWTQNIADAHNAALAAEREKRRLDLEHILDLDRQIAAERGRAENWKHNSERYEAARKQLAAEREQAKKLQRLTEDNQIRWMQRAEQLKQQLAAEQEEVRVRGATITQLKDKLAAEQDKVKILSSGLNEGNEVPEADACPPAQFFATIAAQEAAHNIELKTQLIAERGLRKLLVEACQAALDYATDVCPSAALPYEAKLRSALAEAKP